MPQKVIDMLVCLCWKGHFGKHQNRDIWNAIPLCLMWTIWKEHNSLTFEEPE
jgi:hypothetical protein